MVQDHKGFIWLGGGANELMLYDGENVKLISHKISGSGNLMLDREGKIWIGTWGDGVEVLDPSNNQSISFSHDPNNPTSLSENRVQTIFQDNDGIIWLGTYASGLNKYNVKTNDFTHFQSQDNGLSNNRIWDVIEANINDLWVGTSLGLNLLSKTTGKSTLFLPQPNNSSATNWNVIRHIIKASSENLFIGTDKGLLSFNPTFNKFTEIKDKNNEDLGKVYSLIKDRNNLLWLGTNRGLYQYDESKEYATKVKLPQETQIRIVFEDRAGVIFATSKKYGIYKLTSHKTFQEIDNKLLKSPNILYLSQDNQIIIATANSDLISLDKSDASTHLLASHMLPKNIQMTKEDDDYTSILHQTSPNDIWYAQQSKLIKYNFFTKESIEIQYDLENPNYDNFTLFRALNSDAQGNVWIGTYRNGLHIYNENTKTFKHFSPDSTDKHSLSHDEVLIIYRDNLNRMWVGTGQGLNLWDESINGFHQFLDDKNNPNSIAGHMIQSIHQDEKNRLWVGTRHGLNLYDEKTSHFKLYSTKSGLLSNLVRGIVDDDEGNIWITTVKGLSKINPNTDEIKNYDQDNGLLGANYYTGALVKDIKGNIFLSGPRGVDYFNPKDVDTEINELSVVLTGFSKLGKPITLAKPYPYIEDIELSYLDNIFSLTFAALDFHAPEQIIYKYKLEGFDNEWVENNYSNSATYTNLDGGSYIFKVKATNSGGAWNDNELAINIVISPQPWKTWWAYSIYVSIIILSVSLYIRFATRYQKLEIERQKMFVLELEKQVKEKTLSLSIEKEKLSATNKELELLTFQDGLTGLFNRRYFDDEFSREVNRHQRDNAPLSLIMCDIDHFKLYNDHYGHVGGDHCIISIAKILTKNISRVNDSVCRYGGEEFSIILTNTDSQQAKKIADNIWNEINAIQMPHIKSTGCDYVTLSFGINTIIPERRTTPESIIRVADEALYQSKEHGRNQIVVIDSIKQDNKSV